MNRRNGGWLVVWGIFFHSRDPLKQRGTTVSEIRAGGPALSGSATERLTLSGSVSGETDELGRIDVE
jgi:hypothetical protein